MRFHQSIVALFLTALSMFVVDADDAGNATVEEAPPTTAPTRASDMKEWSGCHPPGNEDHKVEIGKKTILCLHIGNSNNWAGGVDYIRVSFQPEADQYSRMHIPNSFQDLIVSADQSETIFTEKNITVGAAVQDKLSFLRVYFDFTQEMVFPYLTAIVDVDGGDVRGITWDDSCLFCKSDHCSEITFDYNGVQQSRSTSGQPTKGCRITQGLCAEKAQDGNTVCDLMIHVVWTGTDSKGKAFQSSAFRYSQFPPQEIENRLSQSLEGITGGESRKLQAVTVPMDAL